MMMTTAEPLLLQTLAGQRTPRPPVWMMRQAGRYMGAYQALRQRYSFMQLCQTPELAVEVSLQPLQAFGFDASIIFSDILFPLEAMGMELSFSEAKGPQLGNPIRHADDLKRLKPFEPREACGFLMQALRLMRAELQGTGTTLIGFAGAPWSLAAYALEGQTWRNAVWVKRWLYERPEALHQLLQTLTPLVADYLCAQVEAGAQVLQIFDTWAGSLPTWAFEAFALPYQQALVQQVRAVHPHIPILFFAKHIRGLEHHLPSIGATGYSIDELSNLAQLRTQLPPNTVLQGNLDPLALQLENPERLVALTQQHLREGGPSHFIFNLGHGVLPQTPEAHVKLVVDTVKAWQHPLATPASEGSH
jgi:uroporphyrinogen decarboxylase